MVTPRFSPAYGDAGLSGLAADNQLELQQVVGVEFLRPLAITAAQVLSLTSGIVLYTPPSGSTFLQLPTAAPDNFLYKLSNKSGTHAFSVSLQATPSTVRYSVAVGETIEVQKISGTWTLVSRISPSSGSVVEGGLVITTGQVIPLDKKYIYFNPPAGVEAPPSNFSGDESQCTLHGFSYNAGDETCNANGTGHLASFYYSNHEALSLILQEAELDTAIKVIRNDDAADQAIFVIKEGLAYPDGVSFTVAAGSTITIQKLSGTWRLVTSTSETVGGLELGTEDYQAYPGDLGALAYTHSQETGNPHGTTAANVGAIATSAIYTNPDLAGNDSQVPSVACMASVASTLSSMIGAKLSLSGGILTGPVTGTAVTLSGILSASSVSLVGQVIQDSVTYTPSGSTLTVHTDVYSRVLLNLTSGSGLLTATLDEPTGPTSGLIYLTQHATTQRDLDFISTAPISWVGPQPEWEGLVLGSVTLIGWDYDGSEFFLSAAAQLQLGTTTGTAADGGTVATLSSTLSTLSSTVTSLSTTVNGKMNNGFQNFAAGTATVFTSHTAGTNNYNSLAVQMGGSGTYSSALAVLLVSPPTCFFGHVGVNSVTLTTTATTFANAALWRAGLSVLALSGGQLTGSVTHTEVTTTPSGTTATITLGNGNHQTLSLASSTGDVTTTFTVPASPSSGTLIMKQHGSTARDITWAVSAGTIRWVGTEPTWNTDATSSHRLLSWRYDGSVLYLAATEVAT